VLVNIASPKLFAWLWLVLHTHMQLMSETSFRNRRMRNRANSQHCNVMYSTFTDLPMKEFYVITVNSCDDDHEIIVNCLEIKRKQTCVNYFVH